MKKYFLIALIFIGVSPSMAQEDGPPQEPPYVDDASSDFENMDDSIVELPLESDVTSTVDAPLIPVETDTEKIAEELDAELEASQTAESIKVEAEESFAQETQKPQLQEEVVYEPQRTPKDNVVVERSAKGGYQYVKHPLAAKGLTEIRSDGTYIYKTSQDTKFDSSGAFRFGMMDAPRITAADGTTFEMMYAGGQQPYFSFDLEWQPFKGFGLLGVTTGFGLLLAQGQGRFLDSSLANIEAKEKYTFVTIPLSLGLNYRFQYVDRQIIVPYIAAGASYYGVIEYRDDGKTKAVGTPGAFGGGGILLNITGMSREAGFTLKKEYGIANLYVSLDYKYAATFTEDLDFSSHIIGAGIVADY